MTVRRTLPVVLTVSAVLEFLGGVILLLQGDAGGWALLLITGLAAVVVAYRIGAGHLPWHRQKPCPRPC